MSLAAAIALLRIGAGLVTALLATRILRLFRLPSAATRGFVVFQSDLAHVVVILNHVLTAEAVLVVSNLCHIELLEKPVGPRRRIKNIETLSVRCQRVCSGFHEG